MHRPNRSLVPSRAGRTDHPAGGIGKANTTEDAEAEAADGWQAKAGPEENGSRPKPIRIFLICPSQR